jgi:hypothetical protein
MSLKTRLAKLEETAAVVVRCAWCRYSLVEDAEVEAAGKTATRDFVMRTCPHCGNQFRMPLEGLTPKEREAYLLWAYTSDGETYRDERAYAAQEWCAARQWVRLFRDPPKTRRAHIQRAPEQKPSKYARARAELKAEADELAKALRRRERKLYGPRTFPLVSVLKALSAECKTIESPHNPYAGARVYRSPDEKAAALALIFARKMAECERVLWGGVEPETAREIEARSAEVAAFDEKREAEKREREERESRERAEREGRERERSEAMRPVTSPAPVVTPAPVSRFRKSPTGTTASPEPARMVYIPDPADPSGQIVVGRSVGPEQVTYDPNHPDAVQFMRSTPEKLPDHQKYYRGEYYDGDPRY